MSQNDQRPALGERYRARLEEVASGVGTGEPPAVGHHESPSLLAIEARRSGLTLSAAVTREDARVAEITCRGLVGEWEERLWRVLLEIVCGAGLQEAAEHGVQRLEALLRSPGPGPVAGIVFPHNADRALGLSEQLLRDLYREYRTVTGEPPGINDEELLIDFGSRVPSPAQSGTRGEGGTGEAPGVKRAKGVDVSEPSLDGSNLPEDLRTELRRVSVQKGVVVDPRSWDGPRRRLVIAAPPGLSAAEAQRLLTDLEHSINEGRAAPVELLLEGRPDRNPRRLRVLATRSEGES